MEKYLRDREKLTPDQIKYIGKHTFSAWYWGTRNHGQYPPYLAPLIDDYKEADSWERNRSTWHELFMPLWIIVFMILAGVFKERFDGPAVGIWFLMIFILGLYVIPFFSDKEYRRVMWNRYAFPNFDSFYQQENKIDKKGKINRLAMTIMLVWVIGSPIYFFQTLIRTGSVPIVGILAKLGITDMVIMIQALLFIGEILPIVLFYIFSYFYNKK